MRIVILEEAPPHRAVRRIQTLAIDGSLGQNQHGA